MGVLVWDKEKNPQESNHSNNGDNGKTSTLTPLLTNDRSKWYADNITDS